ncbi:MAG: hypothetical protein KDC98_08895 [Planctomycetes bacterium]|nr:hypothetical protein [Planctomycetota bacterium]
MHSPRNLLLALAAPVAFAAFPANAPSQGDLLYTMSDSLHVVDLATMNTVATIPVLDQANNGANWSNGMARDPVTGMVWAIIRFYPTIGTRRLCTLDLTTGVATIVGTLTDRFASIAFRQDGTLFGVTGDGANVPETLYTIDKTTAQATFVATLGNGNDGEAITFGMDGLLYHASGNGVPNVDQIFESIDTGNGNAVSNITLSGYDSLEVLAMTPYAGDLMLACTLNWDLLAVTTSGHVSLLGTLWNHDSKGIVIVPSPSTQAHFRAYGSGCQASGGAIPILIGSGTPIAGRSVSLQLRLTPTQSFGLLAWGSGSNALQLPWTTCQLEVSPLLVTDGFVTPASGITTFPIVLPPAFPPIDLYLQCGVVDGGLFALSNAVRMHTR